MNYIKQLQADKAEALDAARSIEAAINHLISYLSCPKFHVDTRVQVSDVLRDLVPIRNDVVHVASYSTAPIAWRGVLPAEEGAPNMTPE
jgi:hypothetical protein